MRCRSAIALICALILTGSVHAVERSGAIPAGSYLWTAKAPWFGGFSGLEVSDDGSSMLALSDRSILVSADLQREDGRVSGVKVTSANWVRSSKNKPLIGRAGDSEGLAIGPDGGHYISFEGVHRLAHYTDPESRSKVLPRPKVFKYLASNGSFEPLAIDAQGRLYTMPESSRAADGSIPVYRWDGRRWSTPYKLPQRDDYLPVGADFGPDGRLYVLERATGALGFRSRLRRWTVSDTAATNEETVLDTRSGAHENLEGVSIWRDGEGKLRATMISDDNFMFFLRTEIVEYTLPE
ncbi:esterase-like activity of phytase family protein [Ruegeria sp. 2205SS24-7]|uniref:esterase-like activity of phytase family protein n=1 Tax=Ruegeria discodermiae TaxID=3064389 RepID=UPI0027406E2A|nr:esterase-like activity of phytase family protein [Ruegeria sp. 2205SS24-7]MDP5217727.1 esterase-like activity of phytase family protein [Ruegeria sp. 2205SS24-7]